MTVTTVRPNADLVLGDWDYVGAASMHAATSDNSDATYVEKLTAIPASPDAGEVACASLATSGAGVHLARGRFRGIATSGERTATIGFYASGSATYSPGIIIPLSAVVGTTVVDGATAWAVPTGVSASAATVYAKVALATINSTALRFRELYVDWDLRARPTFTPDVQDGLGVSKAGGTITNTSTARLVFGTINNDSLVARTWQVTIEDTGTATIVYTASGTGTPPASITSDALPNGSYEAHFQSSSTIQTNTQWDSLVYDVVFDVDFTPPDPPAGVTADLDCVDAPSVGISWEDPESGTEWDTPEDVIAEVRRTDCEGTELIAVVEHGITGTWCDRFMALSRPSDCDESPGCDDTQTLYEVRYWGMLGGAVVSTEWTAATAIEVPNASPGSDWIRGPVSGDMAICPDISWPRTRPFASLQPIGGGRPVVNSGSPGGRDYQLVIATASHQALLDLEDILANTMVHYTPADPLQSPGWFAPSTESVERPKVNAVHVTTVTLVQVDAEPIVTASEILEA